MRARSSPHDDGSGGASRGSGATVSPQSRARYLAASAMASLPQWATHQAAASHRPRRWRWNERAAAASWSWSSSARSSSSSSARTRAKPERNDARRDRRAESADWTVPDGVSHGDVARQPAGDHVHPSHLIAPDLRRPDVPETYKKKPVALLMGYVGAGYSGNTTNASLPRGSTVDDVLEDALFDAGCILLSNYRSRSLSRLKWSRSSRTDKGVSSLATVVSARLEVDPGDWDTDPEGTRIAANINRHLPNHVRVFAAYSTPKSFQARRACVRRTYDYLLPARCLGLNAHGERDESIAWPGVRGLANDTGSEVLSRFRRALEMFEGSHYFHNYTRRSAYAPAQGRRRRGRGGGDDDEEEETEGSEPMDEADDGGSDDGGSVDGAINAFTEYVGSRRRGCYWLKARDDDDLVGVKHARKVNSFVAADPAVAGPGCAAGDASSDAPPFVRVTVNGDSFMLYQIRKMIATAVAAALGHFPIELIPASLTRPARIATPIAPASTLYLVDAEFMSFRPRKDAPAGGDSSENSAVVPNRLDALVPGAEVRAAIAEFQRSTLDPALAPAVADAEWSVFVGNLRKLRINDDDFDDGGDAVGECLAAHAEYAAMREERRAEREERERDAAGALAEA